MRLLRINRPRREDLVPIARTAYWASPTRPIGSPLPPTRCTRRSCRAGAAEWDDLPGGQTRRRERNSSFSPYPVDAVLVLKASNDARPAIQPRSAHATRSVLPALCRGSSPRTRRPRRHLAPSVRLPTPTPSPALLQGPGSRPRMRPIPTTLRQCLALRRAAANGGPVINQLCDDDVLAQPLIQ